MFKYFLKFNNYITRYERQLIQQYESMYDDAFIKRAKKGLAKKKRKIKNV
jgi:hypothetical protein